MLTELSKDQKFKQKLDRLIELAEDDYYNPYETFKWPETLPDDKLLMSKELMSVYDTPLMDQLTDEQLYALSRWESVNFYGLNVHGIRELIIEVVARIHQPGFEIPSQFFHHFVGEENEHMWFFAQFCLNYGGKIYEDKKMKGAGFEEADIQSFLVFARILIFEEIVDHFNSYMAKDESLHDIVRQINHIHHQDESRHIAFGRQIVVHLWEELQPNHDAETLAAIGDYVKRFLVTMLRALYNPQVYKDAGIPDPYKFRNELLASPERKKHHARFTKRTTGFLHKHGIIADVELEI